MVRAIALALLLVLAGCTGVGGPGQPAATESPPSATPTTADPTPTATHTETNEPTPTDATSGNTVEYSDLSETQQRAFDEAIANGSAEFAPPSIRESPYVEGRLFDEDDLGRLRAAEFVVKDGAYYRLSLEMGRLIASYGLQATESDPSENATVVPLGDLSADAREPVRRAIENGSYGTQPGRWSSLPQGLDDADYVRYNGSHYEISAIVGDYWVQSLSVIEA